MLDENPITVESSELEHCVSDSGWACEVIRRHGRPALIPPALVCLLRPLWVAPHHLCWKLPSRRGCFTAKPGNGDRCLRRPAVTCAHVNIVSMTLKGRRGGTCARDKRCAFALIRRKISGPLLHFLPVLVAAANFRLSRCCVVCVCVCNVIVCCSERLT